MASPRHRGFGRPFGDAGGRVSLESATSPGDAHPVIYQVPPRAAAIAGLRAMKTIATANGAPIAPATRNLLEAAQRHVLHVEEDLDALAPITPSELATLLVDPVLRRQFAQGMTVVSLASGPPSPKMVAAVESFAVALGVTSPEVEVIRGLVNHHSSIFKLDFLRRSHIADIVKQQAAHQGFVSVLKGLASFRGVYEDTALAERYRALEVLPEGTLGKELFHYTKRNGFSFPGEKFGFPESGIYHDFAHVLSGYPTDSAGEIQVGGLIAGFKRDNPFFVILFVMLTFGAGVNVTPLEQPHVEGILAEQGLADRFFLAVRRGMAMKVDISDGWDHWAWVDRPIDEVRAALGVLPVE